MISALHRLVDTLWILIVLYWSFHLYLISKENPTMSKWLHCIAFHTLATAFFPIFLYIGIVANWSFTKFHVPRPNALGFLLLALIIGDRLFLALTNSIWGPDGFGMSMMNIAYEVLYKKE